METQLGYLTVYSADRREIYGEFADATWKTESTGGGTNHLFEGTASEGTIDTFRRINLEGIENLSYDFEARGYRYTGKAHLLMPEDTRQPGGAMVRIESGEEPKRS